MREHTNMKVVIAILLTFILVGILGGCGNPEVVVRDLDGRNGTNTITKIEIDPDSACPRAVYAQELYESRQKRGFDGVTKLFDSSVQRRLEIEGHEVETRAATMYCGVHEATYRRSEAQAMQNGYNGLFKNMTLDEIEGRMEEFTKEADKWIARNRAPLSKLDRVK